MLNNQHTKKRKKAGLGPGAGASAPAGCRLGFQVRLHRLSAGYTQPTEQAVAAQGGAFAYASRA